jgi:hypothetical protein
MTERGIIIGGNVLPGTDRVIRDSTAWWASVSWGTRPRKGHRVTEGCLHWTTSAPSTGPDAGRIAVRNTRARKNKKGGPLEVAVHFFVFPDAIFQTCDLADAAVHIGHRPTILRSVGIEIDYPGTHAQAKKLGIPHEVTRGVAKGLPVKAMVPPAESVANLRWLVDALCSAQHPLLTIPRKRARLTEPGWVEHADAPGTKVDCAGVFWPLLEL